MRIDADKFQNWLRKNYDCITRRAREYYEEGLYEQAMSLFIEAQAYEGILAAMENPEDSGIDWVSSSLTEKREKIKKSNLLPQR